MESIMRRMRTRLPTCLSIGLGDFLAAISNALLIIYCDLIPSIQLAGIIASRSSNHLSQKWVWARLSVHTDRRELNHFSRANGSTPCGLRKYGCTNWLGVRKILPVIPECT